MRTKRRRLKRKFQGRFFKPVILCSFSPAVIFLFAKLVPTLTAAALLCAGITMPEGAKAMLIADYKQSKTVNLCDSTIELSSESDIQEVSQPTDEGAIKRDGNIVYKHYSKQSSTPYINLLHGQIKNCTSLSNDEVLDAAIQKPEFKIQANAEPQVLIYHTHATESFEPYERSFYDASYPTRSTDTSQNMVAVGDAVTAELEVLGIGVIHSAELHDYPSYTGSYANSAKTISAVLAEHPSIKVVLDIHRDAIESNGTRYAAVAQIDGKNASQIMIISGCDDGTMDYPNFKQNLRLASLFQQQIEADWPGLTRPVLFDYRKYNQNLSTGGLLIEVGSHGNTLEQSVYTGHLIGQSIGKALTGLE